MHYTIGINRIKKLDSTKHAMTFFNSQKEAFFRIYLKENMTAGK